MAARLEDWIGRTERRQDVADARAYARLASVLDHGTWPWPAGAAPRLGHWLNFSDDCPQSALGPDGHPPRGGFLPPVALPRRMWAGGRLRFHGPLALGAPLERFSTILDVASKGGRSGDMVFVRVGHEVRSEGRLAVVEEQDLVYRAAPAPPQASGDREVPDAGRPEAAPPGPVLFEGAATPDAVMLFRYSALTWNAHRIHYDAPYAEGEEGYRGLVVHGPLTATLLMDLLERSRPGARVAGFSFRARAPLFAGRAVRLTGYSEDGGFGLEARDPEGRLAMSAHAAIDA